MIARIGIALFSLALCSFGQTNRLVMPAQGRPLTTEAKIVNRIPEATQARWPKELPVFTHTGGPREFASSALKTLLAESAFRETNTSVTRGNVRLLSRDGLSHFIVNPVEGRISVYNSEKAGAEPPPDAVPSFDAVRERAFQLARLFGVSTNEMERNEDGSLLAKRSVREVSRRGGRVRFIRGRTVELARSLAGQTFGSLNHESLALELGIGGQLLKFDMKWPLIEAVTTNSVFSIAGVFKQIKMGKALTDSLTRAPAKDISEIEVKELVIDYYAAIPLAFGADSAKANIYPVASVLVDFKSKNGETQEGGLYVPIMESR